ncbi:MAG: biotin-dependent carboxyltransferase family protein [Actinomycetota bacterium]
MIRILTPAIASSVQDQGRLGHRMLGFSRSGAMDRASLASANRLAGADRGSAGVEFGPGPMAIEVVAAGTLAFAGARRSGAPWWQTLTVAPGDRFRLGGPLNGMWSYLAVAGGLAAPVVLGSRSTTVAEGIGSWLAPGDLLEPGDDTVPPEPAPPLPMEGPIRIFGLLSGVSAGGLSGGWTVGSRVDRMGYVLEGRKIAGGRSDLTSEPLMPGCIQIPPGGSPIVLMAECPTVGGYTLGGIIHSEDLRLLAQAPPGRQIVLNRA